jgi:hypothetical protein
MQRYSFLFGVSVAAAICCVSVSAQAGTLNDVREEVHGKNDEKYRNHGENGSEDEGTSDDSDFGSWLFYNVVSSPFWLPYHACGDTYEVSRYFETYPYGGGAAGSMRSLPESDVAASSDGGKWWSGEIGIDGSQTLSGVGRLAGSARLDTSFRFGLQATWLTFGEWLPNRQSFDSLSIGDADLTYRFAQSSHVQFRVGAGARFMLDPSGNKGGVNLLYAVDVFPVSPLVVTALGSIGSLGKAGVVQGRLTAGAMLSAAEVFAGWDYLSIGDVRLSGPMLGTKLHF